MKTEPHPGTILVVDDDAAARKVMETILSGEGHTVECAATVGEAVARLRDREFDLVITDLRLGDDNGLDIVTLVRESFPHTESILVTAYGSIDNAVAVMRAGASDYITKPFDAGQLLLRVQRALERRMMRAELTALRQQVAMSYGFDNIIGVSRQVRTLKATAQRIAPTDITVLITGPSGTGKELFARAIHHHSRRRHKPFVAIDCSAIPEQLLESELFGHARGSFTSAHQDRCGLLESADGGTVFLDELANMPAAVQVKLLRFLQDSVIRPVGSSEPKKVDVRVIAATNRDLVELVNEGKFREDLYYRLNVIPLYLPPLAERAEDIEVLAEYFLRRIAADLGKTELRMERPAVEKLQRYDWPGNVRELENTLKRAAALCPDDCLRAEDIVFVGAGDRTAVAAPQEGRRSLTLRGRLLDDTQRTVILQALEANNWNYTRTAAELGIGRTTLWRKVKKYGLSREHTLA